MTISARTIENRRHLRRHLRTRENRLRFVNGWIGTRWPLKLSDHEEQHDNEEQSS
jgi:hypothetical protein